MRPLPRLLPLRVAQFGLEAGLPIQRLAFALFGGQQPSGADFHAVFYFGGVQPCALGWNGGFGLASGARRFESS